MAATTPRMPSNSSLVYGLLVMLVVGVLSGLALYAGARLVDSGEEASTEATADEAAPSTPGGPVSVRVVARNLTFDKRTINASPNSEVSVTMDNQDPGVLHNVAFYTNRSASTKIFVGQTATGPAVVSESFKAPSVAGNYFFRCDAHPDQMTGSFVVK